jgi:hypothetical protein
MNAMFEAGLTTGRQQGLDEALEFLMDEAECMNSDQLILIIQLHRKLMRKRFPNMEARCTTTNEPQLSAGVNTVGG